MRDLIKAGPLLQLGWVVAFTTLIPLGLGILLDRRLGTSPLFILIGACIGIIAGTVGAVRITTRAIEALGQPPAQGSPEEPSERKEDRA